MGALDTLAVERPNLTDFNLKALREFREVYLDYEKHYPQGSQCPVAASYVRRTTLTAIAHELEPYENQQQQRPSFLMHHHQ